MKKKWIELVMIVITAVFMEFNIQIVNASDDFVVTDSFQGVIQYYENMYKPFYHEVINGNLYAARGVIFEKLIDFNRDGKDELLIVYHVDSGNGGDSFPQPTTDYRFDVWSTETEEVNKIGSGYLLFSNGGWPSISIVDFDGKMYLQENLWDNNEYRYLENDSWGVASTMSIKWSDNDSNIFMIDSKEVGQDEWYAENKRRTEEGEIYPLFVTEEFELDDLQKECLATKEILAVDLVQYDFFDTFIKYGKYQAYISGLPVRYAKIDVNCDDQYELILEIRKEDGEIQYYYWYTEDEPEYFQVFELNSENSQEDAIFLSLNNQALVKKTIKDGSEIYDFYQTGYHECYRSFSLILMPMGKSDHTIKILGKGATEPQTITSYSEYDNLQMQSAIAILDMYIGDLSHIHFQNME